MATRPRVYALSPLAEQDLEAIYLYTLRTWSREQALSYHSDLVAAFEGLAAGDQAGPPGDHSRRVSQVAGRLAHGVFSHRPRHHRNHPGVAPVHGCAATPQTLIDPRFGTCA